VSNSVELGKYGRIVPPKKLRLKYGMDESYRLIVTEYKGRICLIPVKKYDKPTQALSGSVKAKPLLMTLRHMQEITCEKKLLAEL
jgi:bifunctional DNA-binding transcriptional regulator/antitoxin component of YhaV-PrlF toxin-antitoxin module